jgi:hypothetical protein
MALQLSIDGAHLHSDKPSEVWVFIWVIHNLPPAFLVIVRGLLNPHRLQVWVDRVQVQVPFSQPEKNLYPGMGGYRF